VSAVAWPLNAKAGEFDDRPKTAGSCGCMKSTILRKMTRGFRLPFALVTLVLQLSVAGPLEAFDCIESKCTEMSSCAEAHHKLRVCGHTKRDADGDGIPCEDLCGKDMQTYIARVKAQSTDENPAVAIPAPPVAPSFISPAQAAEDDDGPSGGYACLGKRTCKQMVSCEEARFYLSQCGVRSLDGDGDGTPCNALCR
jgi:hypothetical protein